MSSDLNIVRMNSQNQILINIIAEGEEHLISTYMNEYRSLMYLIQDKLYPDSFGECGGMGRCATCQIKVEPINGILSMDRNEASTLSRHGIADPCTRLSCQILIEASLNSCTIVVLD